MSKKGAKQMSIVQQVLEIIQTPTKSTDILNKLGITRLQLNTAIGRIKDMCVIDIIKVENNRRVYHYIRHKDKPDKRKTSTKTIAYIPYPYKYARYQASELPKEILREDLIDWYIAQGRPAKEPNIKELYKIASKHGIRVYRITENGKKYLN